jgi:hypothetical protein
MHIIQRRLGRQRQSCELGQIIRAWVDSELGLAAFLVAIGSRIHQVMANWRSPSQQPRWMA